MSMIFYLARVSQAQAAALRESPVLILGATHIASSLEAGDSLRDVLNAPPLKVSGPPEFIKEFEDQDKALRSSMIRAADLGLPPSLCLQKEWHVLHFLFTGGAGPNNSPSGSLFAGEPIGEDVGYGPARLLSTEHTAAFAAFLDTQNLESLKERYDWRAMESQRVYGAPYDEAEAEHGFAGVDHFFPKLRSYVADAARRGEGLLLWIS